MANSNENPNNLFREKSIERISSPEDLNDYVKVANPGVWMILTAIIILLAGFCVWAIHGELTTVIPAVVVSDDNHTDCFVTDSSASSVKIGMTVMCDDKEYTVKGISRESLDAGDVLTDYAMHIGGFTDGEWVHVVDIGNVEESGTYYGEIIVESIKPISFIFGKELG